MVFGDDGLIILSLVYFCILRCVLVFHACFLRAGCALRFLLRLLVGF